MIQKKNFQILNKEKIMRELSLSWVDEIEERDRSLKSLIKIVVSKYNSKLENEKRRDYDNIKEVKKSLKHIIEKQVVRNKLKDSVKDLIKEDKEAVVNTIALFIFDDLQNNSLDVKNDKLPELFEHFLSKQGEEWELVNSK